MVVAPDKALHEAVRDIDAAKDRLTSEAYQLLRENAELRNILTTGLVVAGLVDDAHLERWAEDARARIGALAEEPWEAARHLNNLAETEEVSRG